MTAQEFKLARKTLNLTQAALAEKLGWSRRNIVKIESGEAKVTVQTTLAIECLLMREYSFNHFLVEKEFNNNKHCELNSLKSK